MRLPLCTVCKGGKLLCGLKFCPILDRIKSWKKTIENVKDFTGTSPPSIFVGRALYPRVFVGILSPPMEQEGAEILDSPEKWHEQRAPIDQILNWRGEMVYSRFRSNVKQPKGRLVEVVKELAVSKSPANVEIELKKNPKFMFSFDPYLTPIGNPAPIVKAELTDNVSVEQRIDGLVSDYDIKANEAILDMYNHRIPVSRIQKIFSAGLLGMKIQRKFVPTRWSWTGTHDTIGENLRKQVIDLPELSEFRVFHDEYIGNRFEILLLPGPYQYELVEVKHPKSVWNLTGTEPAIHSDYENYWGRKTYAANCGGAWYAAKMAALQYLKDMKRQATVLIIREVLPSYYAPCGVWVIENIVRGALQKCYERFDSLDDALKRIKERLAIDIQKCTSQSKLLKTFSSQKKIKDFIMRLRS